MGGHILGRQWPLMAVLVAMGLIIGGLGVTYVTGSLFASGNSNVIEACANGQHLRIVDGASECKKNEVSVSWNEQGAQGDQGIQGDDGPQGIQGDDGDDGTSAPLVYGPTSVSSVAGGTNGTSFPLDCGTVITDGLGVVAGILGELGESSGRRVNNIRLNCKEIGDDLQVTLGSVVATLTGDPAVFTDSEGPAGIASYNRSCGAGSVVTGLVVRTHKLDADKKHVVRIKTRCEQLSGNGSVVTSSFAGDIVAFRIGIDHVITCPTGKIATGLKGRAGFAQGQGQRLIQLRLICKG